MDVDGLGCEGIIIFRLGRGVRIEGFIFLKVGLEGVEGLLRIYGRCLGIVFGIASI
jgi:hypothetical protein